MIIILLFLAILPTLIMGTIIYKNDKIEKESPGLLVALGVAGLGSVIVTLVLSAVSAFIHPVFAADHTTLDPISLAVAVFIGIALIEEFSKWIFVYVIAWKNREFNHVYDAIVYCVFVSLGFATLENILYVFSTTSVAESLSIALTRMIFSVPGHAFLGVMMGYYLGLAKLTNVHGIKDKSTKNLILSILIPTIAHGFFDYLLMLGTDFAFILFLGFVVTLFTIAITKIKQLSNIPTLLFNDPNNMTYVYNAFQPSGMRQNINNQAMNMVNQQPIYMNGPQVPVVNNQNVVSNNIQNNNINNNNQTQSFPKFCKNCGSPLTGSFCGKCGTKN